MKKHAPAALIILDGFGYNSSTEYNAIAQANAPFIASLLENYPTTLLAASGQAVGLPEGYDGNSEVGHLTIGCGAAIAQPFTIVTDAIESGEFFINDILVSHLQELKLSKKTLHIIGLLSDAAVHSHIEHLFAFLEAAFQQGITDIVVHGLLDGRDVPPQSAEMYLSELEEQLKEYGGVLGSIQGRFYGMDRNNNSELTQKAYDMLTKEQIIKEQTWYDVLKESYQKGITDEFVEPTQLVPGAIIRPGDGLIMFNFRPDRIRQLTKILLSNPALLSFLITPVSYGAEYKTVALYQKQQVSQTLSKFLHDKGCSLFFIAETEKYAHVTYFFNGGRENKYENETRVLIPSLTPKQFETHPCMSAPTITQAIIESLKYNPKDFYVINYANADMVGHTGNFNATVKAIECLDRELSLLFDNFITKFNGTLYITADHGKAEQMFDEDDDQPRTAHTTNPVPFIMVQQQLKNSQEQLPLYELSDIAPFVIHTMFGEL